MPSDEKHAQRSLPLTVEVVDAITGWHVLEAAVELIPDDADDDTEPLVEMYSADGVVTFQDVFEEGGGEQSVTIGLSPIVERGLYPDPIRDRRVRATLSRRATSFRVIEPLRPEAHIFVRPALPDGSLAPSELVVAVDMVGPYIEPSVTASANGYRVGGFAHLAGEPVNVRATFGELVAAGRVILGARPADAPTLELLLRKQERRGGRRNLSCGSGCGRRADVGTARIEIDVVDRGGRPLADVFVSGGSAGRGRTDSSGHLTLENVAGDNYYHLELLEPGYAYGNRYVLELADGETRSIVITEGPSYDLLVHVRDETGAPARFARIDVEPKRDAPWVHLVRGVQTLTVMTDANGDCRLPRLPWLDVKITARFGSRRAQATVKPGAYVLDLTLGSAESSVAR